jgi:hypothetical protein
MVARNTYLASSLAFLQQAALPVREPGWEDQGYWGRPITQSQVRPLAVDPAWQELQIVRSLPDYNTVIREFIATTLTLADLAGVEFRIRTDQTVLTDIQFPVGANRNHGLTFPLTRQKVFIIASEGQRIVLEGRNLTPGVIQVASGMWGWYYYDPDGTIVGDDQTQVDVAAPGDVRSLELFDA